MFLRTCFYIEEAVLFLQMQKHFLSALKTGCDYTGILSCGNYATAFLYIYILNRKDI